MPRRDVLLGIGTSALVLMAAADAVSAPDAPARVDGHQYQTIEIVSEGGARCTLHREGKLLGQVTMDPGRPFGMEEIRVDTTESKADILVACSLGDVAKAALSRWGRNDTIIDGPPCQPGDGPDCRSAWSSFNWEYLSIVRVLFR
jgi:hypothetical protein